jgi:hypothetical protein
MLVLKKPERYYKQLKTLFSEAEKTFGPSLAPWQL